MIDEKIPFFKQIKAVILFLLERFISSRKKKSLYPELLFANHKCPKASMRYNNPSYLYSFYHLQFNKNNASMQFGRHKHLQMTSCTHAMMLHNFFVF